MATDTNTDNALSIRPTKKQRELLSFIEQFITEHGYSPSYREIMAGLNYTSVATVSLHVTSLIRRGHLRKRDRSARSLEVVPDGGNPPVAAPAAVMGAAADNPMVQADGVDAASSVPDANLDWLTKKIDGVFAQAESNMTLTTEDIDNLGVIVRSLEVLGFSHAAAAYNQRLQAIDGQEPADG
jgi:SOS-response transcriptional repressor LexA